MRVAVLSDIHANLHALEAVAKDLEREGAQEIWCLGDIVGYGGHPHECLGWVVEHATYVVKGNHDDAVVTGDTAWFNPMAAHAARKHAQLLNDAEKQRLAAWPLEIRRRMAAADILLVHGSPEDPLHEYVQPNDAIAGMRRWHDKGDLLLMGHTHLPFAASPSGLPSGAAAGSGARRAWRFDGFRETPSTVDPRAPFVVNPGSVGQPRDGDARASYALLDLDAHSATLRRVSYDVDAAAQAIAKLGLDSALGQRLYRGR